MMQKYMFMLFVHGEFIFHLIFSNYYFIIFFKSLSKKCIALLYNYYFLAHLAIGHVSFCHG